MGRRLAPLRRFLRCVCWTRRRGDNPVAAEAAICETAMAWLQAMPLSGTAMGTVEASLLPLRGDLLMALAVEGWRGTSMRAAEVVGVAWAASAAVEVVIAMPEPGPVR